jgi:hypothetical protein
MYFILSLINVCMYILRTYINLKEREGGEGECIHMYMHRGEGGDAVDSDVTLCCAYIIIIF